MESRKYNCIPFFYYAVIIAVLASLAIVTGNCAAYAADPFAANNALYPSRNEWKGPFRPSNYNYPDHADSQWLNLRPRQLITTKTASGYMEALKTYLSPSLHAMIDDPDHWNPLDAKTPWFSVPWTAEITGNDATSGREAILGSFPGQVIQGNTFEVNALCPQSPRITLFENLHQSMQNHTVIYYDRVAATLLRKVWADPFAPDIQAASSFPEGSIIIKAGAVTARPEQWDVVDKAAIWHIYRPPFRANPCDPPPSPEPVMTELRVLQFDVIVKDSVASPKTGWVFATWVYDAKAPGSTTWDRLVPLGAMWGNDPDVDMDAAGVPVSLKETWINPQAPAYALKTLGWQGRLSGPIDVSLRHDVLLTNGEAADTKLRASSCLSCHGTAQHPFLANLYPSPNKIFPQDGLPFLLYPPKSKEWAQWFQDRPGNVAQSAGNDVRAIGLDYDMVLTFALSNFNRAAGNLMLVVPHIPVH